MNAYELANTLETLTTNPNNGEIVFHIDPIKEIIATLREQAAEIGAYRIELELHKAMIQDLEKALESSLALNKALVEKK